MEEDIRKEIIRLSNLRQNKGKEKSFIERKARISIQKKTINIENRFVTLEDKSLASKLFDDYINSYDFETFTDLNTLADLIVEEVLKFNLQKDIAEMRVKKQYPSDRLISSLHSIENRVLELKERLNIEKSKKEDPLNVFQHMLKRFDRYIPFNRNEFTTVCSDCGTPLLLRRRCKDFENLKHPFFSGRFYYNPRGIALVKEGIWTKEQYAWTFYTSPRYVDWVLKHEHDIIEIDGIKQEEIEDFINTNPYLKNAVVPSKILDKPKKDFKEKK